MTHALQRMGARLRESTVPVDFAFVDHVEQVEHAESPMAYRDRLPGVIVGLDGSLRNPRGASAAARIAWAATGMPATAALAARLGAKRADAALGGAGLRIGVSLVLEPKTAAFARVLADAGCAVAVFSAVSETDPEIAAELARDERIAVFAPTAAVADTALETDAAHAAAILDWSPDLLIDDGAHLVRLAHTERPAAVATLLGAAEETTSGVRPVREMAALDELRIPVIAVNDAHTKTDFDNRIGTGQSCVFAIADVLDGAAPRPYAGIAGSRWAVIGYGPVGQGVAQFAAALGAEIVVVEQDPVRALLAIHDGHEAAPGASALPNADVVVSATGVWHTLGSEAMATLRDGAVVAVAGGIDDEIALDDMRSAGWSKREIGPGIAAWRGPGTEPVHGVRVLAAGGGINYTAGEGNPIEVMDLSFATQIAALMRLLETSPAPGVHLLSAADEHLVAEAALIARGGGVDPASNSARTGGAAQPWRVHRYRAAGRPETP